MFVIVKTLTRILTARSELTREVPLSRLPPLSRNIWLVWKLLATKFKITAVKSFMTAITWCYNFHLLLTVQWQFKKRNISFSPFSHILKLNRMVMSLFGSTFWMFARAGTFRFCSRTFPLSPNYWCLIHFPNLKVDLHKIFKLQIYVISIWISNCRQNIIAEIK